MGSSSPLQEKKALSICLRQSTNAFLMTDESALFVFLQKQDKICLTHEIHHILSCERQRRSPKLLLLLSGLLLLRFDTRQFLALLFQLPPRFTRLEPFLRFYPFQYSSTHFLCVCIINERHQRQNMQLIFFFAPYIIQQQFIISQHFLTKTISATGI